MKIPSFLGKKHQENVSVTQLSTKQSKQDVCLVGPASTSELSFQGKWQRRNCLLEKSFKGFLFAKDVSNPDINQEVPTVGYQRTIVRWLKLRLANLLALIVYFNEVI